MKLLMLILTLITYPGKVADATNRAKDRDDLDLILFGER